MNPRKTENINSNNINYDPILDVSELINLMPAERSFLNSTGTASLLDKMEKFKMKCSRGESHSRKSAKRNNVLDKFVDNTYEESIDMAEDVDTKLSIKDLSFESSVSNSFLLLLKLE